MGRIIRDERNEPRSSRLSTEAAIEAARARLKDTPGARVLRPYTRTPLNTGDPASSSGVKIDLSELAQEVLDRIAAGGTGSGPPPTADLVPYAPAVPGDWTAPPDDVAEALDELGARVKATEGDVTALEAADTAQDARLDAVEAADAAQDARLDGHDADLAALDGRVDALETRADTDEGRLDALESEDAVQDGRLDALEAEELVQDARLDVLESPPAWREFDIVGPVAAGDVLAILTGVFSTAGAQAQVSAAGTPALPATGAAFRDDARVRVLCNGDLLSKGASPGRYVYWVSTTQLAFNFPLLAGDTIAIETSPASAGGGGGGGGSSDTLGSESVDFVFGSASPLDFAAVPAGATIIDADVIITQAFDDPSTVITLGLASATGSILNSAEIDPTQLGTYSNDADFLIAAPDSLRLQIVPGASTQGAGRVVVTVRRP